VEGAPIDSTVAYFEATERFGDPVADPDRVIAASPSEARAAADRTYMSVRPLTAVPGAPPPAGAPCRTLMGPSAEVALPPGGLALRPSGRGPVSLAARRWARRPIPAGPVPGTGWVRVAPGHDGAHTPLRVIVSGFEVRVCPLPRG
jgi:hypothetical protein